MSEWQTERKKGASQAAVEHKRSFQSRQNSIIKRNSFQQKIQFHTYGRNLCRETRRIHWQLDSHFNKAGPYRFLFRYGDHIHFDIQADMMSTKVSALNWALLLCGRLQEISFLWAPILRLQWNGSCFMLKCFPSTCGFKTFPDALVPGLQNVL